MVYVAHPMQVHVEFGTGYEEGPGHVPLNLCVIFFWLGQY